jgi:hypothetical protein
MREREKCLFDDAVNCSDYVASRYERNTRLWDPSGITMRKKQQSIHGNTCPSAALSQILHISA